MTYIRQIINMREQPLSVPNNMQVYQQNIVAGNDYNGSLPDNLQTASPTEGGRWMFNDDVTISRLEFRSVGVEGGAGRATSISAGGTWYNGLTSGFYLTRLGGQRSPQTYLILDLSGTNQFVAMTDPFVLKHGEILRLVTGGATLAMSADATVEIKRPYL